jgi:hypothetical protein
MIAGRGLGVARLFAISVVAGCAVRLEEFNAERDAAQRLPVRLANAAAEDAGFDPRGLALRLGSRVATMMLMLLQDNEGITVAGAPGRSHPRMPPGALGGAGLSGPGSSRRNTHPTIGDSLRRDAIAQHGQHGKGRNLTTQTSPKCLSQPLPDMSVFPLRKIAEIIRYVAPVGSLVDAYPVHLITRSSLAAMAALTPGSDFDVRRFRPNPVVDTEPGYELLPENSWCNADLDLPNAGLHGEIPTLRCVMPPASSANSRQTSK